MVESSNHNNIFLNSSNSSNHLDVVASTVVVSVAAAQGEVEISWTANDEYNTRSLFRTG